MGVIRDWGEYWQIATVCLGRKKTSILLYAICIETLVILWRLTNIHKVLCPIK